MSDVNIAEFDWLIDYSIEDDGILHAPDSLIALHYQKWWEEGENYGEVYGPAPALCGQHGEWSIPGVGSRMGAQRCPTCCDLKGYPHGEGSPKNDQHLRAMLRMDGEGVR